VERSILMLQNSIQSEETAKQYTYYLDKYRAFYQIDDYDSLTKTPQEKSQHMVEDYTMHLKKMVGPNSVPTYIYPLKAFYEANDLTLNWRKIKKLFPALQKKNQDERHILLMMSTRYFHTLQNYETRH